SGAPASFDVDSMPTETAHHLLSGHALDSAASPTAAATTPGLHFVAPTSALDVVFRSVDDVLDDLPRGRQGNVRTVGSDAELQSTYDALTTNATPFERVGYDGTWVRAADDVEIGLRNSSASGGRTIDIRMADGSIQKVHIE
ncbi:MAG: hypothetical protein GY701_23610, partial [Sulfitobacter sp.]|nr:hypothetical protein [Sulfitobacter sp.]